MLMRLILVLLTIPAAAQMASIDRLRAGITYLTSPALDGRLSLTKGDQAATDWLAAEMKAAGVAPGVHSSFEQRVPLLEYRLNREQTWIDVRLPAGEKKYTLGASFHKPVRLSAPIVFAGFGITAPEAGYDDYAGLDVRGKMVLVFDHEPRESDPQSPFAGSGLSLYAHSYYKMTNAARRGAVALLLMPDPGRTHPTYAEISARRPRTSTVNSSIAPQILEEKDAIPIFTVSEKVGQELLQTEPKAIQAKIESGTTPAALSIAPLPAKAQIRFQQRKRGVGYNVIGMIQGSDPQLKNEAILFTGHHDHNGRVGETLMPGADDNASGSIAVLELARLFAAAPRPKRTLLFIIFAAEERGLLGAYHYVSSPVIPFAKTRAVLNFDMVGRNETQTGETRGLVDIAADTSNELNLIGCVFSPQYCAAVENADQKVGLAINHKWDHDVAFNVLRRSDHFPFLLRHVPALWWFTGFHPDYHQPTDTVEKINFEKLAKIVNLAFATGMDFADTANPPSFRP